jgi:hypothetical protein
MFASTVLDFAMSIGPSADAALSLPSMIRLEVEQNVFRCQGRSVTERDACLTLMVHSVASALGMMDSASTSCDSLVSAHVTPCPAPAFRSSSLERLGSSVWAGVIADMGRIGSLSGRRPSANSF